MGIRTLYYLQNQNQDRYLPVLGALVVDVTAISMREERDEEDKQKKITTTEQRQNICSIVNVLEVIWP